jgi:4-oxalocrotonate tautomerase family enzyme
MPFVNVKLVKGQATLEQKNKLVEGITGLIVSIMGRDKNFTVITIDELENKNCAIGGKTLACISEERIVSFVNIKVSKGTTDSAEILKMMKATKDLVKEVLGGSDETNYFIMDELDPNGWGFDGLSMIERAKLN